MVIIYLVLILMGCSVSQEESEIPEEIQRLENLTVFQRPENPDTLTLHREQEFEDTDSLLFGRIYDIDVDNSGRVFIGDIQKQVLYVFNSNGRLLRQLGGSGKGPGEFVMLREVEIRDNYLYAYDPKQQQVTVFTLDTLARENRITLARNRGNYQELDRAFPRLDNFYVRHDQTYIVEYRLHPTSDDFKPWDNVEYKSLFYPLDEDGDISSKNLLDVDIMHTIVGGITDIVKVFFGRPMIALSSNDNVYVSEESDHFLIKIHAPNGAYQRAFYYPHPTVPLTKKSASEGGITGTHFRHEFLLKHMEAIDLPQNWPILNDMKIDDQDQLWVATTVEDMNVYVWWVLKKDGELMAKFEWPRDKPIEEVKNGYMYTRETGEMGAESIVKYKYKIE